MLTDPYITAKKIAAYTKQAGDKRNFYFAFILYTTFGLTLIRFFGVSTTLLFLA